MAAISLPTRGAHVGLKSYMAGTCDQARVVLSSNSLNLPACSCVSITLPKRQLKLPGDHQAVRDSRGGVSDRFILCSEVNGRIYSRYVSAVKKNSCF